MAQRELGIDDGPLSAKITATFGHSVTTTTERSYSTTYGVGSPPHGKIRVWMLWQLVHDIAALGNDGKVIASDQGEGDVYWWGPGDSVSGAYLSYGPVQVAIPSTFYVPDQADFRSERHSARFSGCLDYDAGAPGQRGPARRVIQRVITRSAVSSPQLKGSAPATRGGPGTGPKISVGSRRGTS